MGADSFTVPLSKGGDVQLALGVGRIRRDHAVGSSLGQARHPRGPWVDSTTPQEEAWLDADLDPDDPVIAWLHTSLSTRFQDSIEPGCEAAFRLLITRDRVALVAISHMGDVTVSPLPDKALILTEGRTPSLQVGDQSWEPVGNSSAFRQVASLPAHVGSARLRAAAAKATEAGAEGNILADHLLTRLLPEDAPIDRLIAAARARPVRDGELRHALAGLPRNDDGALALAEWAAGWNPALEVVERVLASLVQEAEDPAASRFSLPLHRVQRDRVLASTPDPFAKAEADIALA